METVIPRWEWRTFAASFGDAERGVRELEASDAQESDEVYFLAPGSDANVKIRNGLMDIKTLEQVNADSLEQWRPVMKGEFPLSAPDVEKVCAALQVTPPAAREVYTLEQLQAELTHLSRGVRVVRVHKKRRRGTVGGCLAEVTEVVADGQATRTVAIECEDPTRVQAAVQEMGLDRFENVNYPRGLKRLVGMAV